MAYILFYLIFISLIIVFSISALVFLRNALKDLEGEEIFDTDILQSLRPAAKSTSQGKTETVLQPEPERPKETEKPKQPEEPEKPQEPKRIKEPEKPQEPERIKEPERPKEPLGPDWPKIIEKISTMRVEEAEEAEQFALTYFMQYGASKINFPKECMSCGGKTVPQVLRWKAVHKIPALRGAKTPARVDTNNLWTIVGKCSACDEKYILATQNADGMVGDLEWVMLQHDNYDRLLAFKGKKISKEKLSFVLRTLPDRSLIASGLTGEWIWLKSEYRSYV